MSTGNRPEKGAARYPGVSVQDLLDRDSRQVPEYLREQSYRFLGDDDIPYSRYTSASFHDLEVRYLWPRTWQWACREEHIPEPGDYYVYDIGPYSVIITRTESGEVRAWRNSCMHRGTKLKPSFSSGHATSLRCPYHGWDWHLDGTLKSFPCEWDFPHVRPDETGLSPVRVAQWGGFIFVNLDPEAPPLSHWLDPLPRHVAGRTFSERYISHHVQKELNCNWKIASEAFLEAYHVMETHAQLMRTNGDANTQYDIYGDYVSRLINVAGIPSAYCTEKLSEQDILDLFLVGDRSQVTERLTVPEEGTARRVMAQFFRDSTAATGSDLGAVSDSEIVDSIAYFVFPNQQFFVGLTFPIVYRFRPLGSSPERSLFDLILLAPRPKDGSVVEPAEPVWLKAEDSYTSVPGMDPYVGHVFDQDTGNMQAAQEGAMTAGKAGATLGNYQEIRIRHFHQTLMKTLHAGQEKANQ
ncbi:MAG: aromatic ring-hydroxylating dioxygenase subunit alpha [Gammaproteobacteria bacterium]|nr:aromatic ring-hydroxylating dioxygenase subunit alpha [Gammaproteobacteria bacterium]